MMNILSIFLGSVAMVQVLKLRARKDAVSALIEGFLFSRAATHCSEMGSKEICQIYGHTVNDPSSCTHVNDYFNAACSASIY